MSKRMMGRILGTTASLLVALAGSAGAQSVSDIDSEGEAIRRPASTGSIAPLTSRFVLNGETLDYSFRSGLTFGASAGTDRNSNSIASAGIALSNKIHEGVVGGVFSRRQTGWYLQLSQMDRTREVTTTQWQAVDVIGFRLQLSVTGDCIFPDTQPGQLCTYTPGLATDPDAYDPATMLPTNFVETGLTGDVISQETYDALKEEGWQRGVEGGDEVVGVDFDIPNSGSVASAERAWLNGIKREENVQKRGVLTISKVDQNLYSNGERASLDRTIRGFVLLESDEWNREAVAIQTLAWVLPGMNAKLPAVGEPNFRIPNNLFYAANNQWTPRDSYTVYQSGLGYVEHMKTPPKNSWETPVSWYNGFWMGFSPVRSVESSTASYLVTTADRETTQGPYFAQGGVGNILQFPNSSITIIDEISNQISEIRLSDINNLFVQSGLELTSQAALAYSKTTERSYYSLVPHVAFSGNRTAGASVFRYYAGVILDETRNAYAGADYNGVTRNGISISAKAVSYSNPDRDYYSFAELKMVKSSELGNHGKLRYGIAAKKEFDRPDAAVDKYDALSRGSVVDFLAGYDTSSGLSYDLRHRISEENDDHSSSTTLSLKYRVSDRFSFSGQITPSSNESAYIRAMAGFSWRVSEEKGAGTVQVQWADIKYDYGLDSVGQPLETSERSFLASFQVKF